MKRPERIFRTNPNRVLVAHTKTDILQQRHSVPPVQYTWKIVRVGTAYETQHVKFPLYKVQLLEFGWPGGDMNYLSFQIV